jgi:DNA-directed RNA polymerase subunit beta'
MHSRITAKVEQIDSEGATFFKRFETTPGRLRLGALLPKNHKAPLRS